MLALKILAVSLAAAVFARLVFVRNLRAMVIPNWLRLLLAASTVVGVWLTAVESGRLENAAGMKNWPTAEGTITKSEVVGKRAIRPQISYEYRVDGRVYQAVTDMQAPMFGDRRKKLDVAEEISEENRVGQKVKVFYDPTNPEQSTLIPHLKWNDYAKLGLGAFLFLVGATGVLWPIRRRLPT